MKTKRDKTMRKSVYTAPRYKATIFVWEFTDFASPPAKVGKIKISRARSILSKTGYISCSLDFFKS